MMTAHFQISNFFFQLSTISFDIFSTFNHAMRNVSTVENLRQFPRLFIRGLKGPYDFRLQGSASRITVQREGIS